MENFTFFNPPRIRFGRGQIAAPPAAAAAAKLRARGRRRMGEREDITPERVEKIRRQAA